MRGNDPPVAVTAPRRAGKTSSVRSAPAEHPGCVVWQDMRGPEGRRRVAGGGVAGLPESGAAEFLGRNAPGGEENLAAPRTVRGTGVAGTGMDPGRPGRRAPGVGGLFGRLDG